MRERLDRYIRKQRPLRTLDLAILLNNVFMAASDPEIGFEDANETLDSLVRKMNHEIQMDLSLLEAALWSCNMLKEKDKFWHPRGLTFRQFVKELFPNERFSEIYHMLEEGRDEVSNS